MTCSPTGRLPIVPGVHVSPFSQHNSAANRVPQRPPRFDSESTCRDGSCWRNGSWTCLDWNSFRTLNFRADLGQHCPKLVAATPALAFCHAAQFQLGNLARSQFAQNTLELSRLVYDINLFMNTDTIHRLQSSPAKYFALQGFQQVAVGVLLLLAIFAFQLPSAARTAALAVLFALFGIAMWRIGAYYDRRFGHVELRRLPWTWIDNGSLLKRAAYWIAVVVVYEACTRFLHLHFPVQCWIGVLFLAMYVVEGRPKYYVLLALAFLLTAMFDAAARYIRAELVAAALIFIVAGVIDHLFLVRSFCARQGRHTDARL
jgi:hypothetical protein